jgi:hypothetical protein
MPLTDNEKASIISIVQQNVIAEVQKRIDAEKAFVLSALKIAAWVTAFIAGLFTFVGWNSLEGIKEQAKKDIVTSTEAYLAKSSSVKEIQETLDKYHAAALVSYHLTHDLDEQELRPRAPALVLSPTDAEKLIDIVCRGNREQWIIDGAAQVLIGASTEDWWGRYEHRLGDMVAPRTRSKDEPDRNKCQDLDPSLRASIIEQLSAAADTGIFNRLRPILDTSAEDPELKAAVIRYGAVLSEDAIGLKPVEALALADASEIRLAALEYLARWHPADSALVKWLENRATSEIALNSKTAYAGFRIVSILLSSEVQATNGMNQQTVVPIQLAALKALADADIRFVPLYNDSASLEYWIPLRWRRGVDRSDRPMPVISKGRAQRIRLESEVFRKLYARLIAKTIADPPSADSRKELKVLLDALFATGLDTAPVVVIQPLKAQLALAGAPVSISDSGSKMFEIHSTFTAPGAGQSAEPDKNAGFILVPVDEQRNRTGASSVRISDIHGSVPTSVELRRRAVVETASASAVAE